jgi:hypothetical protein
MFKSILAVGFTLVVAAAATAQTVQYDPSKEVAVTGVIRYVVSVTAPDGTVGVHLELTTPNGPVRVHIAPAMFVGMNNFSFLTDETVAITGAKVTKAGETAIWARQVVKDGKTLVLRDDDGTPRWPRATMDDPDGCGLAHAPVR